MTTLNPTMATTGVYPAMLPTNPTMSSTMTPSMGPMTWLGVYNSAKDSYKVCLSGMPCQTIAPNNNLNFPLATGSVPMMQVLDMNGTQVANLGGITATTPIVLATIWAGKGWVGVRVTSVSTQGVQTDLQSAGITPSGQPLPMGSSGAARGGKRDMSSGWSWFWIILVIIIILLVIWWIYRSRKAPATTWDTVGH